MRAELREALIPHKGRRIMLFAHFMGTIIAYDVLREIGHSGEPVHTEFLFQEIDRHTAEIQTPRNYVVEEAVFILLQRAVLYFFIGPVVVELVEVERLIFVLGILVEKIGPIDISKSNTRLSIPQFFFQPLKDGLLPPILQSLLVRLVGQAVNAGDDI